MFIGCYAIIDGGTFVGDVHISPTLVDDTRGTWVDTREAWVDGWSLIGGAGIVRVGLAGA